MKLAEVMENITVFIDPLKDNGCYNANVRGSLPSGETVRFDIELSKCYSEEILQETISSTLEEIFSCKYHYEVGEIDEKGILYDGGTYK